MLRYAWEEVDADGEPIDPYVPTRTCRPVRADPRVRPEEIDHAHVETHWE